jgi:hypothetical protein
MGQRLWVVRQAFVVPYAAEKTRLLRIVPSGPGSRRADHSCTKFGDLFIAVELWISITSASGRSCGEYTMSSYRMVSDLPR